MRKRHQKSRQETIDTPYRAGYRGFGPPPAAFSLPRSHGVDTMRSFILLVELPDGPSHVLQACLENSK